MGLESARWLLRISRWLLAARGRTSGWISSAPKAQPTSTDVEFGQNPFLCVFHTSEIKMPAEDIKYRIVREIWRTEIGKTITRRRRGFSWRWVFNFVLHKMNSQPTPLYRLTFVKYFYWNSWIIIVCNLRSLQLFEPRKSRKFHKINENIKWILLFQECLYLNIGYKHKKQI